jgi:hypothetical protein
MGPEEVQTHSFQEPCRDVREKKPPGVILHDPEKAKKVILSESTWMSEVMKRSWEALSPLSIQGPQI